MSVCVVVLECVCCGACAPLLPILALCTSAANTRGVVLVPLLLLRACTTAAVLVCYYVRVPLLLARSTPCVELSLRQGVCVCVLVVHVFQGLCGWVVHCFKVVSVSVSVCEECE